MKRGLVSVMRDGQVFMKLIAHTGGENAAELARRLGRSVCLPTIEEAFREAETCGFGGVNGLVVVTRERDKHNLGIGHRVGDLYRNRFDDPHHNSGTTGWSDSDCDKVVQL